METNDVSRYLDLMVTVGSDLSKLQALVEKEDADDNKVNEKIFAICSKEFTSRVWCQLEDVTKYHIRSAFLDSRTAVISKGSFTSPIQSITEAFESELKYKIFEDFNNEISKYKENYKVSFDQNYIKQFENEDGYFPSTMLLGKLKHVGSFNRQGTIAHDLAEYLRIGWDLYALSSNTGIETAYSLLKIRNKYSHPKVEKNIEVYKKAHQLTIETLKWFISALK